MNRHTFPRFFASPRPFQKAGRGAVRRLRLPGFARTAVLALLLSAGLIGHGTADARELRVGISYCEDHSEDSAIVESFTRILEQSLPGVRLSVRRFEVTDLEPWVKAGEIDIFLANSGLYRMLINYGAKDIATAVTPSYPDPNLGDGSAWIARSDRSDIRGAGDFAGKRLATKGPGALLWYFAAEELSRKGLDPERTFRSNEHFVHDTPKVVEAVLSGRADVGVVPACFVERWEKLRPGDKGKLKVLEPKPGGPCAVSTDLYPNWTVAITPSMPPGLAKRVTSALLTAPPDANGVSWAVATRFDGADRMLRDLRVGHYAYLREWTVKRVFREYGFPIGAAAAFLLALAFYGFYARGLIARRTRQLRFITV